ETWSRYRRLASLSPSPADFDAPRWRRYEAYLLRYENLLWNGDVESAAKVSGTLVALEQDLLRGQRLNLTSLSNTLAMPSAAGYEIPNPEERFAEFKRIWDAKPDDAGKLWFDLLKSQGAGFNAQTLRVQFYEFLLVRAEQGLPDDLAKAYRLIQ